MRALTVKPGRPNSIKLEGVAPPRTADGAVLVSALALGICGTDREIITGNFGWAPEGLDRLILGHESLGCVVDAPAGPFSRGDLVVGIVRRPDPYPALHVRSASGTCAAMAATPSAASRNEMASARSNSA